MKHKYKALVVDDDFAVANLHKEAVNSHPDFMVTAIAHSVTQAKQILQKQQLDLILLDLYLPDQNGLELLHWLRIETNIDLEVIALTADRDLKSVRFARQHGVFHYLVKPFNVKQLHDRLSDLVFGWQQLSEGARVSVDQGTIDAIMGAGAAAHSVDTGIVLPKGVSKHTLELVWNAMQQLSGDSSANELAEQLGLSRVSARRYLDYLAATGKVQVLPQYGSAGRPEFRYQCVADC